MLMTMIKLFNIGFTQKTAEQFFGFLRHSQFFEQLFVLINTKEVFWNMQALLYR